MTKIELCDKLEIDSQGLLSIPSGLKVRGEALKYRQPVLRFSGDEVLIKSKETKAEIPIGRVLWARGPIKIIVIEAKSQ